ncbi:MAG: nickel pincer cofactor biosynthesis protein LarC [Desulfatiglans sp.]|nr:nickel pincer cofactor biosynthesis protein LarC [Desulfatiglans sp.]
MTIAYIDCFSGISGDMFLGALLDLGLPFNELKKAIESLPFEGYSIDYKTEMKNGLKGTRFIVSLNGEHEHHDNHHNHEHHSRHEHHDHHSGHSHDNHHEHDLHPGYHAQHEHRGLPEIEKIINAGVLSEGVKRRSLKIFRAIAEVEGAIHNHAPEEVHFHEVGAIDSIIDIVGAAFGVDYLGIASFYSGSVPLSSGFIQSGHGTIPLPAPATAALLKGIPVHSSGLSYELVTPTGAAILKEFVTNFSGMPPMIIKNIGYGAGTRAMAERPNLLRIITGEASDTINSDTVAVLEANIDDANPEWLGFIMDRLFSEGAYDVNFMPIHMKKNRPAIKVEVIASPGLKDRLANILFMESTTIGVRESYCQRVVLKREETMVESPWGQLKAKRIIRPDGSLYIQPEYEACKRVAEAHNIPLRDIYAKVIAASCGL